MGKYGEHEADRLQDIRGELVRKFVANKNDSGQRLDKFIKKVLKFAPDSLIYKCIRKKRIKVNGKREDESYKLCEGDVLEFYVNDDLFFDAEEVSKAFLKIKADLEIIYEDRNLMLINKKPGITVHNDESENFNTLINHIQSYLYNKGEFDHENELSFKPSLCNRLDRNTGGIIIAAKNAEALRAINHSIKYGEIEKKYLCVALGQFTEMEKRLRAYHFKDEVKKEVQIKAQKQAGYKEIVTEYKVLKELSLNGVKCSLLEVNLVTGRTHQIRAHLAYMGHPLAGDGKYGRNEENRRIGARYQYLYSYKLKFKVKDKDSFLHYLNHKEFSVSDIPFLDRSN